MSEFLFSGLLVCARCDKHFVGTTATGNGGIYPYYTRYLRHRYGPRPATKKDCRPNNSKPALIEHIVRSQRRDHPSMQLSRKRLPQTMRRCPPTTKNWLALKLESGRSTRGSTGTSGLVQPGPASVEILMAATTSARGRETGGHALADQLEDKEIPRVKKGLQKVVNKILQPRGSRSAIKPSISLPLVLIKGSWVER